MLTFAQLDALVNTEQTSLASIQSEVSEVMSLISALDAGGLDDLTSTSEGDPEGNQSIARVSLTERLERLKSAEKASLELLRSLQETKNSVFPWQINASTNRRGYVRF